MYFFSLKDKKKMKREQSRAEGRRRGEEGNNLFCVIMHTHKKNYASL